MPLGRAAQSASDPIRPSWNCPTRGSTAPTLPPRQIKRAKLTGHPISLPVTKMLFDLLIAHKRNFVSGTVAQNERRSWLKCLGHLDGAPNFLQKASPSVKASIFNGPRPSNPEPAYRIIKYRLFPIFPTPPPPGFGAEQPCISKAMAMAVVDKITVFMWISCKFIDLKMLISRLKIH